MKGISNSKNVLDGTTILIETTTAEGKSRGTGFMFAIQTLPDEAAPLLITNKHVINSATSIKLKISLSSPADRLKKIGVAEYTLSTGLDSIVLNHPSSDIDLAAINIATILNDLTESGYQGYGTMFAESDLPTEEIFGSLGLADEIVMIGYPTGLSDEKHNLPIVRQGTLASDPRIDFNGHRHFLIDCACFPGSSGSPIVLKRCTYSSIDSGFTTFHQRPSKLLGILYAGPTHTSKGTIVISKIPGSLDDYTEVSQMINLGYVIPSHHIKIFKELLSTISTEATISSKRSITIF